MAKRIQTAASIALGAAALLMLAVVVFRPSRTGAAVPVSFGQVPYTEPLELPEGSRVDLNLAGREELMELPGIGEDLADRIIARREEYGPFRSPEDVMAVKGIGEITWASIAPFVTF